MAGAPAGPALSPEGPADRLDAVRETDESRPVRRGRGLIRLGQGALLRRCAATCAPPRWRGRLSSARPAPGGPCRGQRAVLEQPRALPASSRGGRCSAEPQAQRACARRTRAAPRRCLRRRIAPSKREVEPARKRERVAASLREDPLSHALVEWPFVPILPRSCCWGERRPRARALLRDRESLSKGRGAPVNLSSCSPLLSSRTYGDVATVVDFDASSSTRRGTSR
jgi:hypothetical protein